MFSFLDKLIPRLFYTLLFFVPLVLWPFTSELFEFNKMVFVYVLTVLITAAWILKSISSGKFILRRTILDIPLVVFLLALALSTFFSIDVRTSLLGYYSRFHGGLFSYLSYSLLYWAYVSNMNPKKTLKALYFLISSAFLVSIYGVLQHFGIDKNIWVQDVQNRIFSTLGQPNWLAAWIVALTPLAWSFSLNTKHEIRNTKFWLWLVLSSLFFIVLLFTKSRSGLLAFVTADIVFWVVSFLQLKKKALSSFIIHHSLFMVLVLTIGTPFTINVPAPETGGTESGEIRKIVWQGALELWRKYPVLGTGPETFAYSYYETRPMEHNLVSEWDFLYNKAHNEYLNFGATTGTVGLATYLILIAFSVYQIVDPKHQTSKSKQFRNSNFDNLQSKLVISNWNLRFGILAGYISILVTNFFGFSVVPIALLFFMFPAFAVATAENTKENIEHRKFGPRQKILVFFVLGTMLYALYRVGVYWSSDLLYAKGRLFNDSEKFLEAREFLARAVKLSPKEAVFWDQLSQSTAELGQTDLAITESQKAVALSPRNLNLLRNRATLFIKSSSLDPNYLPEAKRIVEKAIVLAPTDAKLYYNLALTTYRLGQTQEALTLFDRTIEMKPNYKNARFAKALILIDLGKIQEAKKELTYILEKIEPNDNLVRQELEKL